MAFFRYLFGTSSYPWGCTDTEFTWQRSTYDKMIRKVKESKPSTRLKDGRLNILILGPKAHGKSSFINSIASISTGDRTTVCNSGGGNASSSNVTVVYRELELPGEFSNIRFCDVTGLTKNRKESENLIKDLKSIIQGHVKHGYKFDFTKPISTDDPHYIKEPTVDKEMHGILIVFDITEAYEIHTSHVEDIKLILGNLNELNVPISLILTKADQHCQCVRDDVANIYRSDEVIKAANKVQKTLGIPQKNIYPVVNFEDKVKFRWKESLPLLVALKACLLTAGHHLYNRDKEHRLSQK